MYPFRFSVKSLHYILKNISDYSSRRTPAAKSTASAASITFLLKFFQFPSCFRCQICRNFNLYSCIFITVYRRIIHCNDTFASQTYLRSGLSKSQSLTALPYYQGSAMHALYQADQALGAAIDQLYAKLQEQAADPMKMGAVQGQYGQFNSAATIIGTLQYNTAVYEYQKEVGGFPASVLGAVAGVKEVEPFA